MWNGRVFLNAGGKAIIPPTHFADQLPTIPVEGQLWYISRYKQLTITVLQTKTIGVKQPSL
jgi:hypothetical protein